MFYVTVKNILLLMQILVTFTLISKGYTGSCFLSNLETRIFPCPWDNLEIDFLSSYPRGFLPFKKN